MQGWYAVDIFCLISSMLHSSLIKRNANGGSLSLMFLVDNPWDWNMCLAYRAAVSSELISSLQVSQQYDFIFSFMPTFFFFIYYTLSHVTLLSHMSHV